MTLFLAPLAMMRRAALPFAVALAPEITTAQSACTVADILFGPISFDILPTVAEDGSVSYESAIVRSATFDNPTKNYGAILGEITVDRGSSAVRDLNHVVVGIISPDLSIEGWDDACDASRRVEFVKVRDESYITLSDDNPVGTLEGRFPMNSFGVE